MYLATLFFFPTWMAVAAWINVLCTWVEKKKSTHCKVWNKLLQLKYIRYVPTTEEVCLVGYLSLLLSRIYLVTLLQLEHPPEVTHPSTPTPTFWVGCRRSLFFLPVPWNWLKAFSYQFTFFPPPFPLSTRHASIDGATKTQKKGLNFPPKKTSSLFRRPLGKLTCVVCLLKQNSTTFCGGGKKQNNSFIHAT